jgi:NAD(P)H-dependent FMN reductase
MAKLLAFTGSNSSSSVNEQLLTYALDQIQEHEITRIKLTDYPAPIYSEDLEKADGIPQSINELVEIIKEHDAFIIGSPEHNGLPTAFLKNTYDWISRTGTKPFGENGPLMLLSTSPGGGGGANGLNTLAKLMGYQGAELKESFSLGSFYDTFKDGTITNEESKASLDNKIKSFLENLK